MKKNRVFINQHDVVEIIVNGDQTAESVQAMAKKAQDLCRQQQAKGERALILDNLLYIGAVPPEGRREVVRLAKNMQYDKLAMVGKGTALRLGANLLLHATGKGHKVKYFDEYDKAVEWLKL